MNNMPHLGTKLIKENHVPTLYLDLFTLHISTLFSNLKPIINLSNYLWRIWTYLNCLNLYHILFLFPPLGICM